MTQVYTCLKYEIITLLLLVAMHTGMQGPFRGSWQCMYQNILYVSACYMLKLQKDTHYEFHITTLYLFGYIRLLSSLQLSCV